MTLRFSDGVRNWINEGGSLKQGFAGGKVLIYSGTRPATANDAVSGALLATYTVSSGAHTAEVASQGSVTLSGTTSGSVTALTVNALEIMGSATAFDTDFPTTATAIANKINNNPKNLLFIASASGAVITITAKPGLGTLPNGWVVDSTCTTLTGTDVNMGSTTAGVNYVNGITFGDSAAGALVKSATEAWTALSVAGTATWFRLVGAKADAGAADASAVYLRVDGDIGTSGSDMNWSNTTLSAATQTLNEFTLTYPAS